MLLKLKEFYNVKPFNMIIIICTERILIGFKAFYNDLTTYFISFQYNYYIVLVVVLHCTMSHLLKGFNSLLNSNNKISTRH